MSTIPWTLAIDFGTSYSVAAALAEGEAPRVLEIDGELRVPSIILIDGDAIVVGRVAEEMSGSRPGDVLRAPKSRLGDHAPVILAGRTFQVAPLVGALLARIYEEAVTQSGSPPEEVRLTYPATWSRTKQARLLDAGHAAGFPASMLVAEPVAAALNYWRRGELRDGGYVAVYDLGGGTFDSAVLRADGEGFRIVGRPDGDPSLGGEMFDEIVVNLIGAKLDADVWEYIQLGDDPTWQQVGAVLRKEARRAKETLSNYRYADAMVSLPTGLTRVRLERSDFETAVAPYIDDSVAVLRRCITEAGVAIGEVAAIQLVGGSSRIPAVEAALRREFPNLDIHRRGDPKNSVALGALIASAMSVTPTPTRFGSSEEVPSSPSGEPRPAGYDSEPERALVTPAAAPTPVPDPVPDVVVAVAETSATIQPNVAASAAAAVSPRVTTADETVRRPRDEAAPTTKPSEERPIAATGAAPSAPPNAQPAGGARSLPGQSSQAPWWHADPSQRYDLRYWDGAEWTSHVMKAGVQSVDPPTAMPTGAAATPTKPPANSPPPGWHADPAQRHELRYWDGTDWTEHVTDGGVASIDPPVASPINPTPKGFSLRSTGWAKDPTGRHELRYWDGSQWTTRVNDRGVEGHDHLDASTPSSGSRSPAGSPAAGWFADPTGRHQLRYWDGANWTTHVSDRGVHSLD